MSSTSTPVTDASFNLDDDNVRPVFEIFRSGQASRPMIKALAPVAMLLVGVALLMYGIGAVNDPLASATPTTSQVYKETID